MLQRTRHIEVRGEEAVARAVRAARAEGSRLRVAGSGGSKSGITATPGALLHVVPDPRDVTVRDGLVTAPAGLTSGALQAILRGHGLTLPNAGEWRNATFGGAVATGTHGGSAHHGNMSTSLRRLRLVTGTGEIVEIGPDDAAFPHAGVSLGALGVVTSVTLACVERFALALETDVVAFDDYRRDPIAQESRSEFHASVWFPTARRVVRFAARRVVAPRDPIPRPERFGKRTAVASFLSRRLGLHDAVHPWVFRRRGAGDNDAILSPLGVTGRVARFRNMANAVRRRRASELAVAATRAPEALARMDALLREHPSALNDPVGLRLTAGDGFSLSPCAGRDTLWFDLFYDITPPFVDALAAFCDAVDARFHWGKAPASPLADVHRRYPAWDAFRAARARFDPDEVFANAFTDELGLTGPVALRAAS